MKRTSKGCCRDERARRDVDAGIHYIPVPLGKQYPLGLLIVQNGEAPEPPDTGDINGFEFDGSTQFLYIDFRDALRTLGI